MKKSESLFLRICAYTNPFVWVTAVFGVFVANMVIVGMLLGNMLRFLFVDSFTKTADQINDIMRKIR